MKNIYLKKTIKKYYNKSFLISYSGGLDSTVLLYQFLNIRNEIPDIKIRAIHVNHNVTSLSKKWTEHCKKICYFNQIPLIIENVYIDKRLNNLEEKLRIQRYNAIYHHLMDNEILLTAHHMNDQCETLLLSLKRGSGPNGLSSMSFETILGEKKIVRPFLKNTRRELELWANNNNLSWIEDFSNFNIYYDRNFIRHQIIPVLEQRWPYFIKNCSRSAFLCKQEKIVLNHFLHEKIYEFIQFDNSLNIQNFQNMKKEICQAFIRYWISLHNIKIPSYRNIESIYIQMIKSKTDANPKIILNKNEIRRYKKSIYFIKTQPNLSNTLIFWHKKNTKLILPNDLGYITQNEKGVVLPAPQNHELINIRFQYAGKILILGRNKKRKIKKIWQEKKIPPWLRNQIPLLFYNNNFISALGVFIINIKIPLKDTWTISWQNDIELTKNSNTFLFY